MASGNYQPCTNYDLSATITSGQTVSAAVDLEGTGLAGLILPSTFDGTAISFKMSATLTGTYVDVQDGAGSTFTLTGAASKYVPISNLAYLAGVRFIKLVSGTAQATTDTIITLVTRPL